jgi:hypothetical protein
MNLSIRAILFFACTLLLLACSKTKETVGSATEALDASTGQIVGNANTPSIVSSRTQLAMAFTGTQSGTSPTRWERYDGGAWSVCDVTNVPSGCNGGSGTPPRQRSHALARKRLGRR